MIAYFLLFALIGFIAGRSDKLLVGLIVVVALALFLGVFWLPLDLVEFLIGYWVGAQTKEKR